MSEANTVPMSREIVLTNEHVSSNKQKRFSASAVTTTTRTKDEGHTVSSSAASSDHGILLVHGQEEVEGGPKRTGGSEVAKKSELSDGTHSHSNNGSTHPQHHLVATSAEIYELKALVATMREQVLEAQEESRRARLTCQHVRKELHDLIHSRKEGSGEPEAYSGIASLLSNTSSLVEKFALFEHYLRHKFMEEMAELRGDAESRARCIAEEMAESVSEDTRGVLASFRAELTRMSDAQEEIHQKMDDQIANVESSLSIEITSLEKKMGHVAEQINKVTSETTALVESTDKAVRSFVTVQVAESSEKVLRLSEEVLFPEPVRRECEAIRVALRSEVDGVRRKSLEDQKGVLASALEACVVECESAMSNFAAKLSTETRRVVDAAVTVQFQQTENRIEEAVRASEDATALKLDRILAAQSESIKKQLATLEKRVADTTIEKCLELAREEREEQAVIERERDMRRKKEERERREAEEHERARIASEVQKNVEAVETLVADIESVARAEAEKLTKKVSQQLGSLTLEVDDCKAKNAFLEEEIRKERENRKQLERALFTPQIQQQIRKLASEMTDLSETVSELKIKTEKTERQYREDRMRQEKEAERSETATASNNKMLSTLKSWVEAELSSVHSDYDALTFSSSSFARESNEEKKRIHSQLEAIETSLSEVKVSASSSASLWSTKEQQQLIEGRIDTIEAILARESKKLVKVEETLEQTRTFDAVLKKRSAIELDDVEKEKQQQRQAILSASREIVDDQRREMEGFVSRRLRDEVSELETNLKKSTREHIRGAVVETLDGIKESLEKSIAESVESSLFVKLSLKKESDDLIAARVKASLLEEMEAMAKRTVSAELLATTRVSQRDREVAESRVEKRLQDYVDDHLKEVIAKAMETLKTDTLKLTSTHVETACEEFLRSTVLPMMGRHVTEKIETSVERMVEAERERQMQLKSELQLTISKRIESDFKSLETRRADENVRSAKDIAERAAKEAKAAALELINKYEDEERRKSELAAGAASREVREKEERFERRLALECEEVCGRFIKDFFEETKKTLTRHITKTVENKIEDTRSEVKELLRQHVAETTSAPVSAKVATAITSAVRAARDDFERIVNTNDESLDRKVNKLVGDLTKRTSEARASDIEVARSLVEDTKTEIENRLLTLESRVKDSVIAKCSESSESVVKKAVGDVLRTVNDRDRGLQSQMQSGVNTVRSEIKELVIVSNETASEKAREWCVAHVTNEQTKLEVRLLERFSAMVKNEIGVAQATVTEQHRTAHDTLSKRMDHEVQAAEIRVSDQFQNRIETSLRNVSLDMESFVSDKLEELAQQVKEAWRKDLLSQRGELVAIVDEKNKGVANAVEQKHQAVVQTVARRIESEVIPEKLSEAIAAVREETDALVSFVTTKATAALRTSLVASMFKVFRAPNAANLRLDALGKSFEVFEDRDLSRDRVNLHSRSDVSPPLLGKRSLLIPHNRRVEEEEKDVPQQRLAAARRRTKEAISANSSVVNHEQKKASSMHSLASGANAIEKPFTSYARGAPEHIDQQNRKRKIIFGLWVRWSSSRRALKALKECGRVADEAMSCALNAKELATAVSEAVDRLTLQNGKIDELAQETRKARLAAKKTAAELGATSNKLELLLGTSFSGPQRSKNSDGSRYGIPLISDEEKTLLATDPKKALTRAAQQLLEGEGASLPTLLRALVAFMLFFDTDQRRQDSDTDTLSTWVRTIDEEIRKVQKFLRPPFK